VTVRGRLSAYKVELGLALTGLLQMLLFSYLQFFAITCELEYHVYSSMLWSCTLLVMALLFVRILPATAGSARTAWIPAGLVLAVPYLLTFVRDDVHFRLLAGFAVAAVASGRGVGRPASAVRCWGCRRLAILAIGAAYAITTAEPPGQTWLHQQRHFPQPELRARSAQQRCLACAGGLVPLVAQLNLAMPQATKAHQVLLTWFGPGDALSSDLTTAVSLDAAKPVRRPARAVQG